MFDLLSELGGLWKRLWARVAKDVLSTPGWLAAMADATVLEGLPTPHLGTMRLTGKTAKPAAELGARPRKKPADWPHGSESKGTTMKRPEEAAGAEVQSKPAAKRAKTTHARVQAECEAPAEQADTRPSTVKGEVQAPSQDDG